MRTKFLQGGTGYGDFKKQLFAKLWEYFAPMRKRREEVLENADYVDTVLARGAERANQEADKVMARVRSAVGFCRFYQGVLRTSFPKPVWTACPRNPCLREQAPAPSYTKSASRNSARARVHIKPVGHRGASVQAKRLGGIHQDKAMLPGQQFVHFPKPGTADILRHVVQFDQQEFCFPRASPPRPPALLFRIPARRS